MRIKVEWYTGKEQDKDTVKQLVINSKPTLELLKTILEGRLESLRRERLRENNYEYPGYPFLMADCNATERCLLEIIDLLTIEEK